MNELIQDKNSAFVAVIQNCCKRLFWLFTNVGCVICPID